MRHYLIWFELPTEAVAIEITHMMQADMLHHTARRSGKFLFVGTIHKDEAIESVGSALTADADWSFSVFVNEY